MTVRSHSAPAKLGALAWLTAMLAVVAPCLSAATAAPETGGRWLLQVAAGVNNMQLGDVKDLYNAVLDEYRAGGVPVESQREFPPNLLFGGDALYRPWPNVWLGLGARYTWTHGYSMYGDSSGTLDFTTRVGLLSIVGVVQRHWRTSGPWTPYVEARFGRGFASFEMTEELVLTGAVTGASTATLSGDGQAPTLELHVGTRRPLGGIAFVSDFSYRYCKVPGPPFDLDASGFALTFAIAFP